MPAVTARIESIKPVLRRGGEREHDERGRLAGGAAAAARTGGAGLRPGRRRHRHRRWRGVAAGGCSSIGPERRVHRRLLPRGRAPVGDGARPPPDDEAKRWAEKLCGLLKGGHLDDVLAALRTPVRAPKERRGDPVSVRAARPDALRRLPLAWPADRLRARRGGLQPSPEDD